MSDVFIQIVRIVDYFALAYIIAVDTIYLVQLISAYFGLKSYIKSCQYGDYRRFYNSENMIPISLIAPAYNEEAMIVDNVESLLALEFPEYEIIVVNDGSTDKTLDRLIEKFDLIEIKEPFKMSLETAPIKRTFRSLIHPNLLVVDKENGGKSDALNAGINASSYPVFVSIDADSILEKDSLIKIIMPFVKDNSVIGVGGIVRIANPDDIEGGRIERVTLMRNPLITLQVVEYLRAFLTGRMGFDNLDLLLIISGAFGAFKKDAVIEVGGYTSDTIGEDMELVVKLHKHFAPSGRPYKIQFLSDPVCWTDAPGTVKEFFSQRRRWHVGLMDSLFRHKDMVFNKDYGRIGMIALPYYWMFEFIGPLVEVFGYFFVLLSWALGLVNFEFVLIFFGIAICYGTILSIGALMLEENTFKKYPNIGQLATLVLYGFIDNLGYRQINSIIKVWATLLYRKSKHSW